MRNQAAKRQVQVMAQQLVARHGKKATTTSMLVAEMFGKRHDNVVRDIRELLASLPQQDLLTFEEKFLKDSYGRLQPGYEITRDGFSLLAMGFTGKRAIEWKVKFLRAFNMMEQALLNQQNLFWQEDRTGNKIARRDEVETIQQFIAYAEQQGSRNADKYFVNFTNMTYRILFCGRATNMLPVREMLNSVQLSFLTTAEYLVEAALVEGMKQGVFYRYIYESARDKVKVYAAQLPKHQLDVSTSFRN
jgi:Rha family phage regulatory protein